MMVLLLNVNRFVCSLYYQQAVDKVVNKSNLSIFFCLLILHIGDKIQQQPIFFDISTSWLMPHLEDLKE
ncbi:hypothetical protein QW71_07800 [Paenibacillus sp. IHB B 3415]|nr:hypothetical protein QW71_07800 [Paenibacillus sp. IHB B 3415]